MESATEGIETHPDDIKIGWETGVRRFNFGIFVGVVALCRLLHPLAMITKC